MRFFLHGQMQGEATAALKKHEQVAQTAADLGEVADVGEPGELLGMLQKKQWELMTTDAGFVHEVYERKVAFGGVIVLLLEAESGEAQGAAIDRLFERYRRLTPRRLYTVTRSRVKIRQLPGAGQV